MFLTDMEQKMLDGEFGELVKKCMQILVTLGEIYGAEKMIPIRNVHSPGVSYRVTGDAGLNYVKDASKIGSFRIPVTLNTIGIDAEKWREVGFPEEFSLKQLELLDSYRQMGACLTCSCTPYLTGNVPMKGESVAWGESSAIAFINSIVGARTNREGGPSALAAAVTGRVPNYGLHLDENRKGTHLIKVDMDVKTDLDFGVLGYFAGHIAGKEIPVFEGIQPYPTMENVKSLSAAVASSGAVALYHIVGITPESPTREAVISNKEAIVFNNDEYRKILDKFTYEGDVDFVVLGCPHCSIIEMGEIAKSLSGKKVKTDVWVCVSSQVRSLADRMGYVEIIEKTGAKVVCDTCPVLCPTSNNGYKTILTNSVKLANYVPGLWNVRVGLVEMENCIMAAINGVWSGCH